MQINLAQLKKEIGDRQVMLSVDTNGTINNTLSPIQCRLKFDHATIDQYEPSSVTLKSEIGEVVLTQIESVVKNIGFQMPTYTLLCGKLQQMQKEYILTSL